jgi:glutathione S-transferase
VQTIKSSQLRARRECENEHWASGIAILLDQMAPETELEFRPRILTAAKTGQQHDSDQIKGSEAMKLIYAPQSPFARKVRAAAIELGLADRIELEYAEVVPGKENPAFAAAINPLRKVPALILDDGNTVLVDSTVICEFLDALAGGGRLIPASGPDRWRVLSQHAVAQGMCEAVILVRYETWLRPQSKRWPDWLDDQWDKIWSGLAWFERDAGRILPKEAETIDLSQLALACCLGYVEFRYPETNWSARFPQAAAWYQEVTSRPSLATTRPQNPTRQVQ